MLDEQHNTTVREEGELDSDLSQSVQGSQMLDEQRNDNDAANKGVAPEMETIEAGMMIQRNETNEERSMNDDTGIDVTTGGNESLVADGHRIEDSELGNLQLF